MYQVKYEGNFVTNDAKRGTITADQAAREGLNINFKTKRDAERARDARCKLSYLPPSSYQIVKVEDGEKVSTEELTDKLLVAITAEYKDDAPRPGLILSKLKDGTVYASVARYNQKQQFYPFNSADKVIVAKTTSTSVRGAIIKLSQEWLSKNVAKDALSNALRNV